MAKNKKKKKNASADDLSSQRNVTAKVVFADPDERMAVVEDADKHLFAVCGSCFKARGTPFPRLNDEVVVTTSRTARVGTGTDEANSNNFRVASGALFTGTVTSWNGATGEIDDEVIFIKRNVTKGPIPEVPPKSNQVQVSYMRKDIGGRLTARDVKRIN